MQNDTDTQVVEKDVVTPVEEVVSESPGDGTVTAQAAEHENLDTENRRNFKAVRDRAEQEERARKLAERERDELNRRLQYYEAQARPPQEEPDEPIRLGDDEFAEGKHVSKLEKKIQKLEKKLESQNQQTTASVAKAQIAAKYPDFASVVNNETIRELEQKYPELAVSISSAPDLMTQAAAAYTLIKQLNIGQDAQYSSDIDKIQRNAAKPKPTAILNAQRGNSPLSQADAFANGMTPELKKQLLREMEECRKRY